MRSIDFVYLGNSRTVTVKELMVRDARNMLAMSALLESLSVAELLTKRFDEVVKLLGDAIQMPDGETLEDLTISEAIEVKNKWLEINRPFLDLIGLALSPAQEDKESQASPTSTESASS